MPTITIHRVPLIYQEIFDKALLYLQESVGGSAGGVGQRSKERDTPNAAVRFSAALVAFD